MQAEAVALPNSSIQSALAETTTVSVVEAAASAASEPETEVEIVGDVNEVTVETRLTAVEAVQTLVAICVLRHQLDVLTS